MDIGFTGTRNELSKAQRKGLVGLMSQGWQPDIKIRFHHGDCIGADATAHKIAWILGWHIIIHPPTDPSRRAFCVGDETRPEFPFLERNKDIVDESEFLIACPDSFEEVLRSGTWSTVRYAESQLTPVYFVWPDGEITEGRR